ncbi:hypothetical protein HHK36_027827 [Tetracentron sinense]|uniref:Molybdenum cofactor sulfurase n=1 Tax=Tetracentron sinense TaxID=13715 RepID=A0A834YI64_TETSI|nr:hypothetical protein HHK36_027827 [Tetracentron sinense]
MQSPCTREASQACFHGCCLAPFLSLPEPHNQNSKSTNTVSASRYNFATVTASSLFPNTQFTNHESIPSLQDSFANFTKAYQQYSQTDQADQIRAQEYYHLSLSNHVCLDYIGLGLFSYSQQQSHYSSITPIAASSSSSSSYPPPLTSHKLQFPFFNISYKSVNLTSQILYGGQESELESAIRKRIMAFLNISEADYCMVFTANRSSAFKLLAESYLFQSNPRLLTVYDYENEAVGAMIDSSQKRGAQVMSAEFSWPNMRIQSEKLRKMVVNKRKRKRGLLVFPPQSQMTGARYSYLWMSMAQENGWHILLDACALGPKEMDTLGLSLFRPDFLICSLFKVFGENPSGLGCLFVKRSSASVLEASTVASMGIVSLIPAKNPSQLTKDSSSIDTETQNPSKSGLEEYDLAAPSLFSGPTSVQMNNGIGEGSSSSTQMRQFEGFEYGETSESHGTEEVSVTQKGPSSSEIVELEKPTDSVQPGKTESSANENLEIECRGLDHADSLGLILISSRARYLINWLVNALMKLWHPHSDKGFPLVRIYGPKIKFERGPAVAFNVFDWKGEKVEPILVQKLADRSNISLSYGFLHHIWFSDKYEEEKERVLETRTCEAAGTAGHKKKDKVDLGISVVTASLSFLTNFEDTYRLWAFVSQFLDADFVEKERWRYMALNQKTIEI